MSNTAERWWVRIGARWLARIDGVKSHIQVASLAVTAFSTFSLVLQNSGKGELVKPLGVTMLIILPVYTYLYTEGGVWNQVSRDRVDLSTNFAGPTMLIQVILVATAVMHAIKGEEPNEQERERIEQTIRDVWNEYRDGVDLNHGNQ